MSVPKFHKMASRQNASIEEDVTSSAQSRPENLKTQKNFKSIYSTGQNPSKIQDPKFTLKTQNPKSQDSKSQDPKSQNSKTQNSKSQNPKSQDPKSQDPKTQDLKTQDPKTQKLQSQRINKKTINPKNGKILIIITSIYLILMTCLLLITKRIIRKSTQSSFSTNIPKPPLPPPLQTPTQNKDNKVRPVFGLCNFKGPSNELKKQLAQELESHFQRGNKFRPSSIRKFKIEEVKIPTLDREILVYGRGFPAYIITWKLIQMKHDVMLITPDSHDVTTHYIKGSSAKISVPNSIQFYVQPLSLTSSTVDELNVLSDISGVPIPVVKRVYEEFITSLTPLMSSPQADEIIQEFINQNFPPICKAVTDTDPIPHSECDLKQSSDVIEVKSYMCDFRKQFPVPESQIIKAMVKFFKEYTNFVEVHIEHDDPEPILRCRKFIIADEFIPTIAPLWPLILKDDPVISGHVGFQIGSRFEGKPFSKVVISGDNIISLNHTGEEMTISVSRVVPYLLLENGHYHIKVTSSINQVNCVGQNLALSLIKILKQLGCDDVDPQEFSPLKISEDLGVRPIGLTRCHHHFRLNGYSNVWILGPTFLPKTRDCIRDTCMLCLLIERIIV